MGVEQRAPSQDSSWAVARSAVGAAEEGTADDQSSHVAVCDADADSKSLPKVSVEECVDLPYPAAVRGAADSVGSSGEGRHLTVPVNENPKCQPSSSHGRAISGCEALKACDSAAAGKGIVFIAGLEDASNITCAETLAGGESARRERAAADRARKKLLMASCVCLIFMVVEVVAGFAANSLALMTDASHLLSDLCAFLIR